MNTEIKERLSSTKDFALLGLKFLYLVNGGAIIAILADINHLIDEEYPAIACAFSLFVWGLIFAFVSNILGYLMYRNLLMPSQSKAKSTNELSFGILAVCSGIFSLFFFWYGAHKALSILI